MSKSDLFVNPEPIAFSPDLIRSVALGLKTVTIRKGKRNWQPGLALAECRAEERGVTVLITNVRHCLLKEVTAEEWLDDGFEVGQLGLTEDDLKTILRIMRRHYPDLTWDSPVTVVRWELR